MRNAPRSIAKSFVVAAALLGSATALVGCAGDGDAKQNIEPGYGALEARQYDAAQSHADAQLAKSTSGPGSADALYIKGRAIEQRAKSGGEQARADLSQARQIYTEALQQNPPTKLAAYIRTSLANVAYWQDDYSAAMQQWLQAYDALDEKDDVRPFVLYRIGLCQQRLGQFPAADVTFASVQKTYPQSEAAERARQHVGFKSFMVQLATFATPQAAENAMNDLRRGGANPSRIVDARGRHVINVGPTPSYASAQQLKSRFAARYPDAVIVP